MVCIEDNKIHLEDFPEDKIVVFLKDNFRYDLIKRSIEIFKGRKGLASYLGIRKLDTISRWKDGKMNRGRGWITQQGIPLEKLKRMSELLDSYDYGMREIEKWVVAYKSKGKSLWLKNPNLPIKEEPELFRIIAHMIGDGSANENNVNYFKNNDLNVRREFVADLKKTFGELELGYNKNIIVFPIAIRHILSKFYGISFGTFDAEVPEKLLKSKKECSSGFIRAFLDDEGNVDTSCIRFYSFNEKLINGVRELFLIKFPEIEVSKISKRGRVSLKGKRGVEYVFNVKSKSIEYFYHEIGCSHEVKNDEMKFYIKRKYRGWNHRDNNMTKLMIIKALSSGPKSIKEICRLTMVSECSVLSHLRGYSAGRKKNSKGLVEKSLVRMKCLGRYNCIMWEITEKCEKLIKSGSKISDV